MSEVEINENEVWEDKDPRSSYDITPLGNTPGPDYEGRIHLASRRVKIIGFQDDRVIVKTLHTGKVTMVKRTSFHSDPKDSRGRNRTRGYVKVR